MTRKPDSFMLVNRLLTQPLILIDELLDVARRSPNDFKIVVKGAVHYEHLGYFERSDGLNQLLKRLLALELETPEIRWEQTVPSTLAITLVGPHGKDGLDATQTDLHEVRAMVATDILIEMVQEGHGAHVAAPVLAAYQKEPARDAAVSVLDEITSQDSLGSLDPGQARTFAITCSAAMSDEILVMYVESIVRKIILEQKSSLLDIATYLIASTTDETYGVVSVSLLEEFDDVLLGVADAESVQRFMPSWSASLKDEHSEVSWKLIDTLISEDNAPLIYVCDALFAVVSDQTYGQRATALLEKLEDKDLDVAESGYLKKLAKTTTAALRDKDNAKVIESTVVKIARDGKNSMVFFLPNLLGALNDDLVHVKDATKRIVDAVLNSKLGRPDPKTLKSLASVGTALMKGSDDDKDAIGKVFGKLLEEDECDFIYFVGPLIAAASNSEQEESAVSILEELKNHELGDADQECLEQLSLIYRANRENPKTKKYLFDFLEKIVEEKRIGIGYFLPFILTQSRGAANPRAMALVAAIDDCHIGEIVDHAMKRIASITMAILDSGDRMLAKTVLEKLIEEERAPLIYIVRPLVGALQDRSKKSLVEGLLQDLLDKDLGTCDADEKREIQRLFFAAQSNHSQSFWVDQFVQKLFVEHKIRLAGFSYGGIRWKRPNPKPAAKRSRKLKT